MVRPIPLRLIRAELVTVSPLLSTPLTDDLSGHASERYERGSEILIAGQTIYADERSEDSPIPGARIRTVSVLFRGVDCIALAYVPAIGDLVKSNAFLGGPAATDHLYIEDVKHHIEGQGWLCRLSDRSPGRRV